MGTLPRRGLELVGERGQLVATDTMGQDAGGRLEFLDAATGAARDVPFDTATSPFAAQLRAVEDTLAGLAGPWPFPLARDLRLLRLLHGAVTAPGAARAPARNPVPAPAPAPNAQEVPR